MKDAEDEAFDELARRQGAWGGGFKAKQGMAMHKTQDQNICRHYKQWQHCHICDLEAQAAELAGIKAILDEYGLQAIDFVADFKEALAQPAQEPTSGDYALGYAEGFNDACKKPAQEPVAWMSKEDDCIFFDADKPNPMDYEFWTPLYTTPPQRERVVFPTMLRKMWSGGEVQAWLDENVNKEKNG